MNVVERPESDLVVPSPEEPITPNELAKFIILGFFHSQGSGYLHGKFNDVFLDQFGDRLSQETVDEAAGTVMDMTSNIFNNHSVHSDVRMSDEESEGYVLEEGPIAQFNDFFKKPDYRIRLAEPNQITAILVRLDARYLKRDGGRQAKKKGDRNPKNGPHRSFVSHYVYFGLKGTKTGSSVLDEIYRSTASKDTIAWCADPDTEPCDYNRNAAVRRRLIAHALKSVYKIHAEHYPEDVEGISDEIQEMLA